MRIHFLIATMLLLMACSGSDDHQEAFSINSDGHPDITDIYTVHFTDVVGTCTNGAFLPGFSWSSDIAIKQNGNEITIHGNFINMGGGPTPNGSPMKGTIDKDGVFYAETSGTIGVDGFGTTIVNVSLDGHIAPGGDSISGDYVANAECSSITCEFSGVFESR